MKYKRIVKKQKLVLSKETIRLLDAQDLSSVAGGGAIPPPGPSIFALGFYHT